MMNDPEARFAASRALGVAADASPAQVRSAFLSRLWNAEFSVPSVDVEAAALLGAIQRRTGPHLALDRETEKALADKLEEFAETYWKLVPAQRRENWEDLMQSCRSFPRLVGRLCDLDQGLDVVLPSKFAEPLDGALVAAIAELYPLKPATRATRRVHLLDEAGPRSQLRLAARTLRNSVADLRRIDRGLIATLAEERNAIPVIRSIDASDRYRKESPERVRRDWDNDPNERGYSRELDKWDVSTQPRTSESSNRWLWFVIPMCFFVCSGVFRGLSRTPSSQNPALSGVNKC